MRRLAAAAPITILLALAWVAPAAHAQVVGCDPQLSGFTGDELLWAPDVPTGAPARIYDIAGGGALDLVDDEFAIIPVTSVPGKFIVVDDGLNGLFANGARIELVCADGANSVLSPYAGNRSLVTGVVELANGRVLTSETDDGSIVDVTAGSAPANVTTSLTTPTQLVQLPAPDGRVLAATATDIIDVTDGSSPSVFASGLPSPVVDLEWDATRNTLWAVAGIAENEGASPRGIYDVTTGGDLSAAQPFATGGAYAIAIDASGRLLATREDTSCLTGTSAVVDASQGGDLASAPVFASALPGCPRMLDATRRARARAGRRPGSRGDGARDRRHREAPAYAAAPLARCVGIA